MAQPKKMFRETALGLLAVNAEELKRNGFGNVYNVLCTLANEVLAPAPNDDDGATIDDLRLRLQDAESRLKKAQNKEPEA